MNKMYYVYVIRSEVDGRFYVGISMNVKTRLLQHNKGMTFSTKGFRPWKLIFFEEYLTRIEARKREKYLKSGVGKEFIKKGYANIKLE
jgi:putative endonuclease